MRSKSNFQFLLLLYFCLILAMGISSIYFNLQLKQCLTEQLSLAAAARQAPDTAAETLEQAAALSQRCRTYVFHSVWSMVALSLAGFALVHKLYHQLQFDFLKPIERINRGLAGLLNEELQLSRLSVSRNCALFKLAQSCNLLLDNWQSEKDHHQQVYRMMHKSATQLIETFELPTLIMVGNKELLLANSSAKDFFIGEAGESFFAAFQEALAQQKDEFSSHAVTYGIIAPLQPRAEPELMLRIYQFDRKN